VNANRRDGFEKQLFLHCCTNTLYMSYDNGIFQM